MNIGEILKRDFAQVAAGEEFLRLIEKAPPVWRNRPAHFHVWLARKLARLTQRELAARAGVQQSFVSRTERGRDVRLSTMRRLYETLGYRMLILPLKMPSHASSARTMPGNARQDMRSKAPKDRRSELEEAV